jgi:carbonic anhydrase
MNTMSYLKQIAGDEKTLIISCIECCMDVESSGSNQFYRHTTLGNVVCEKSFQEESIKYYVESRKCTHIIVAGHTDCKAINSILNDSLNSQSIAFLKTELVGIVKGNYSKYLKADLLEILAIELSVTKLCRNLLTYQFIHERLESERLSVTGVVLNPLGTNKKIFHNGIAYNDLISIN